MTPTSQPFPRALFHPSRCAAPLRGRLPQRTGKGLRASSGEVVRLYRGQPNTTMPHKTLPLSSLHQNVPNMPGIVQTTPSQKPSSSQRTILFEFDKTCVFGRKVQSRGFHLKLIRLPVQNTRPPQGRMVKRTEVNSVRIANREIRISVISLSKFVYFQNGQRFASKRPNR